MNAEKHQGLDGQQLRAELGQYYGGHDQNYKSPFGPMQYTPGVRFFFQQGGRAGAYWVREILSTEPAITRAWQKHGFVFVLVDAVKDSDMCRITVSEDADTQKVADNDSYKIPAGEIYFNLELPYSDLQRGQWVFYIENGLMVLPNER